MRKDYNLIKSIQENNDDSKAYEQLLSNYERMIRKIIYSFNLENGAFMVDEDGLFQEGSLALYKAARNFDMERGIEFSTYAYRVITNNIITRLREAKRTSAVSYYSIDNFANIEYNPQLAVSDNCVEYAKTKELSNDIDRFLMTLSKEDQEYLKMRQEGKTYRQIAEICNVDVKRVDNRLSSIKKRLKRFLNRE